jgi:hypothetical protein
MGTTGTAGRRACLGLLDFVCVTFTFTLSNSPAPRAAGHLEAGVNVMRARAVPMVSIVNEFVAWHCQFRTRNAVRPKPGAARTVTIRACRHFAG